MSERRPTEATVQRLLPAPPDVVFDEWIDPDAFRQWMCPRPARARRIELDPTVGGRLRIDILEHDIEFFVTGRYLEIDRPRLLSFTWSCSTWDDPTLQSTVTVTFEPYDEATTVMTIIHTLLPPELVADHERGWVLIATQLEDSLRGRHAEE